MSRKRKPLSYVFGEPQSQVVKLPPIKSPISNAATKRGSFSKPLTLEESQPELLSTRGSISSPIMKNSLGIEFLPYIYAQNGLEYTNKFLQKSGNYMENHFILNKRKSAVNILDLGMEYCKKSNPRAGTLEVIDELDRVL